MALEPQNLGQEQPAPEASLSQPQVEQAQVPVELLSQISNQISDLAGQITDLKTELSELKTDNSELRAQLAAAEPVVQEQEAAQEPAELVSPSEAATEPEAQEASSEAAQEPAEQVWKSYDKDDFTSDFETALTHMDEVDWDAETVAEDDYEWPDEEPFITNEMVTEMEGEYSDMLAQIASFNAENPADFVQDDPTASTGLSKESASETELPEAEPEEIEQAHAEPAQAEQEQPEPTEVEQAQETAEAPVDDAETGSLDDDEIQRLLATVEEESTEVVPEEEKEEYEPIASGDDDTSMASDEDIQALLAEAAGGEVVEATEESEPEVAEEAEGQVEAQEEVVEEAEESVEDARAGMSEEELASLMSEVDGIAEAASAETLDKPKGDTEPANGDDETVEVGFTAFQAGKDVDGDVSSESKGVSQSNEQDELVERRQVVVASFEADPEALEKVPAHLAIAALAVPIKVTDDGLVCKVALPLDRAALDLIEDAVTMPVISEPADMEEILDALRKVYGSGSLWNEREAVMSVAPTKYKRKKKNFFGRAA